MTLRRHLGAVLLLAVSWGAALSPSWAQQVVYVVRHAEKVDESNDPALSAAGQARAEALARHLRNAGITAIVVNKYQRTQLTAAPLAAQLKLQPEQLPLSTPEAVVAALKERHAAETVLVVGHSNTVPGILEQLGCQEKITMTNDDYDNLYVVIPGADGTARLLKLKF
jgi:broad specificity phosphatase PhoE